MLQGFLRSKDYLAKDSVPKAEYERVLKERNLLLQLIDSLPDSIYAKDAEGRILISNKKNTELLGKSDATEVVGKTDFDFYDKDLAERYRQDEIVLLNSSQDVIHVEEPNVNNSTGDYRWLSTTKVVYRDEHGNPLGLFGIGRDITTRKLIEEELVKSQETFRKTIDTAPSMIYQLLFRPDGTFLYPFVSRGSIALYGVEPERIMLDASIITKMWHPDDVDEYWRQIRYTLDNLVPLDITLRIVLPDGKIKWVRVNSIPEKQPDGSIILYGVRTDVTAQKEAEAKLRLQQQQMNAAADLARLAFWQADLYQQSFTFNDRCFALIGTSFEREGDYNISLQDYLGRFVLADDVPEMLRHLDAVLSSSDLMRGEASYRIRRLNDGEIRYIKVIYNIERNADGLPVRLFGPMQDITEQKQAEEQVRRSEEVFRKTVNAVPGMIYQILFRPDGTIVYPFVSNGSIALYGVEPERIMLDASIITKMWHPDDIDEYMRRVEECRRTLKPFDMECRIVLPDGKIKWLRVHSTPELEPDGGLRFYGVRIDITERKKLEAELAARLKQIQDTQTHLIQTEKMSALGQMVAGIAHELNTPIGYASNNVSLIRERFSIISNLLSKALKAQDAVYSGELEKALAMMQDIRTSPNGTVAELEETVRRTERLFIGISSGFEQMTNLVRSMRNFARLDEAEMKKADINEGIKNSLLMVGHLLKDKDIELTTEYGILPLVDCFPAQLNQVFLNLIGNAIHAVEEKPNGQIHIKTSVEDNHIVVRIQDNGKGIPKHVQPKIFDPFFTTKPVGKGTGLGLSISYDIVKKHNGSLTFETEEGKGTTFIVKIPATDFLQTYS
ncbi:MAG: PAS domain S-box protein [Chloroherpetonaceae bacterium]